MRIESPVTSPTTSTPADGPTGPALPDPVREGLGLDRVDRDAISPAAVWTSAPLSGGHAGAAPTSTMRALAHSLAEGDLEGFDAYLEEHPEAARELAMFDRETAQAGLAALTAEELGGGALGTAEGYLDAYRAMDQFTAALEGEVRETIRSAATMALDADLAALESSTPEEMVDALRNATPGTRTAAMAEALGVRGDAGDLDRVRENAAHAREGLTELRSVLAGQTWSPEELPNTALRVMEEMGLADAPEGSMAAAAFHRPAVDAATAAHYGEIGADVGHLVAESAIVGAEVGGEIAMHGVSVDGALLLFMEGMALPVGVAVAGIAFGVAIHHAIEENRHERTELARSFGL